MQSRKKVLFIRHAESQFNLAQRQATNSPKEVNLEDEDIVTKFSPDLIDCPLSDFGVQQCLQAQEEVNSKKIDIVIVSPLLRAIETAYYLFKDHPSKPKFIIEPTIREMVLSACDVGGKLEYSMKRFKDFDFSKMQCEQAHLWTLDYLHNKQTADTIKEYIKTQVNRNNENMGPGCEKYICEFMSQSYPRFIETFEDTRERIEHAKRVIREEYLGKMPDETQIAVVTHSRALNTFSATQFNEIGEPIDGYWWHNCQAIQLEL